MKKIIKKIHLFPLMIYLLILSLLLGIIYRYSLSKDSILLISHNIQIIVQQKSTLISSFFEPIFYYIILFILGISIIGIPFIIILFYIYSFLLSFEFCSFLSYYSISHIFKIILYFLPRLIRIFSYFMISYYAIQYSFYLVRVLFFNKNISLFPITQKYIRFFFLFFLFIILSSIIEFFIIPRFSFMF